MFTEAYPNLVSCIHRKRAAQVREAGRLVITTQRLYFQPLHDVAGDMPVRAHPLAAVAAVARRRSSLRPTGPAFSPEYPCRPQDMFSRNSHRCA